MNFKFLQKIIFIITASLVFYHINTYGQEFSGVVNLKVTYNSDSLKVQQSNWSLLDTVIQANDIFFVGESHGVVSNPMLHFSAFMYLYYSAGVRYYVMEGNYSFVYFINKYVQTGDTFYLKLLRKNEKNDLDPLRLELHEAYIKFYKKLHDFNNTLPAKEKIEIIGIDSEPFHRTSKMVQSLLRNDMSIPEDIKPALSLLLDFRLDEQYVFLPNRAKRKVKGVLKKLKASLTQNRGDFVDYFRNDLLHIEMIINNAATLNRSDKALFTNFNKLASTHKGGAYYFQYGRLHSQLKGRYLANLLNKSKKFYKKVVTIGTQYNNCDFWFGKAYCNHTFGAITNSSRKTEAEYKQQMKKQPLSDLRFVFLNKILNKRKVNGGFNYIIDICGK